MGQPATILFLWEKCKGRPSWRRGTRKAGSRFFHNLPAELPVLRRIDNFVFQAAAQNGDGRHSVVQSGFMREGIDAQSQAASYCKVVALEPGDYFFGCFFAVGRKFPRATTARHRFPLCLSASLGVKYLGQRDDFF